ncbi:hypothetical protein [Micavibrio aeruginosavorus]|uniref:hypothetical protein n=1 Tax=Micavibrio aeruginosavorus TaxID=349221 RepID=UPI003F4AE6BA
MSQNDTQDSTDRYELRVTLRPAFAAAVRGGTGEKSLWPFYRVLHANNLRLENYLDRVMGLCAALGDDHPNTIKLKKLLRDGGFKNQVEDTFCIIPQSGTPLNRRDRAYLASVLKAPSLARYVFGYEWSLIQTEQTPKAPNPTPAPTP